MIIGMTRRAKIAVTVPQERLDAAQRAVCDGRAAGVSAYAAEAMEQREKSEDFVLKLEEALEESGGPMTDAEREEIDRLAGW
mgnify:CR=1 FL=1